MKRKLKYGFSHAALLIACGTLLGTQVSALDITLNGRVDFKAGYGKEVTEQRNQAYTGPAHATLTGGLTAAAVAAVGSNSTISGQGDDAFIAYVDDYVDKSQLKFTTAGRIDIKAAGETATFDYGAFARLDIDADAKSVSDTDAHVYIKGNFGDLQFGTDIDADLGAFDMSLMSAGPMSAGNAVSLPVADHTFSMDQHDESSIVYTTPSYFGLKAAGEIDDDGEWMLGGSFDTIYNGYDIGLEIAGDSAKAMAARGKIVMGDLSLGLLAGQDDDDEAYWGGGVGYNLAGIAVSLEATLAKAGFVDSTNDMSFVNADELDVVAGASYKLAPGLSLAGSLAYFEREVEGNDNGSAAVTWVNGGHDLGGIQAQGRIRLEF